MKKLQLEDDTWTARNITKSLRQHRHVVDHAVNARDGLFLAAGEHDDEMISMPAMFSMLAGRKRGNG
jgi:DNA-binding response OmpR family regulator